MLYKPAHELAIVLFGATDTRNHAHDETAAAGDDSQYRHIVEAHRWVRCCISLPTPRGRRRNRHSRRRCFCSLGRVLMLCTMHLWTCDQKAAILRLLLLALEELHCGCPRALQAGSA